LGLAACDQAPLDTSGGYSSERLLSVFERECVRERWSWAKQLAALSAGVGRSLCSDDPECGHRGDMTWWPAPELEINMTTDASNMTTRRGDGVHCWMRFWRRPDDRFDSLLADLARADGLSHVRSWSETLDGREVSWVVYASDSDNLPELRLIRTERPGPWTLGYIE
jgi:hypothetical protein